MHSMENFLLAEFMLLLQNQLTVSEVVVIPQQQKANFQEKDRSFSRIVWGLGVFLLLISR